MKIVSWNCKGGFIRKFDAVAALQPDVLIVPEAGDIRDFAGTLNAPVRSVQWIGGNKNKGLAILSFGDTVLALHEEYDPEIKWILPVHVLGRVPFTLLGVWTVPHGVSKLYVHSLFEALDRYRPIIEAGRCMIAGDFNNNVLLDRTSHKLKFSQWIQSASELGLVSAYHLRREVQHGMELDPTFYLQHNRSKPFHIDFVFASAGLVADEHPVAVGGYEEWGSLSDHMPVTCSVV